MGQVIVEIASPSQVGGSTTAQGGASVVEEVTTSGTSAATTATTLANSIVFVHNNSATMVWVNFGAAAAVATLHPVLPNTTRDFGNLPAGQTINVIDDS